MGLQGTFITGYWAQINGGVMGATWQRDSILAGPSDAIICIGTPIHLPGSVFLYDTTNLYFLRGQLPLRSMVQVSFSFP